MYTEYLVQIMCNNVRRGTKTTRRDVLPIVVPHPSHLIPYTPLAQGTYTSEDKWYA